MSEINRTLPDELAELAHLALVEGLDEVHLFFEGLGADFPASIGWQLSLTRVDPSVLIELEIDKDPELRAELDADAEMSWSYSPEAEAKLKVIRENIHRGDNTLRVSAQVGTEVRAFRGMDKPYWDVAQIREWILTPREGIPALTDHERRAAEVEAERMVTAWKLGWSAERTLSRDSAMSAEKITGKPGTVYVQYSYSALNHFFNVEGHPAHRDNGTEVSIDLRLSRAGLAGKWTYSSDGLDETPGGGYVARKTSLAEIFDRVANTPPWHTEVAYFDEDLEEWVR